ncbi:MAG TPA: hypothetical protein VMI56_26775 [Reyranella sp.]|nr:hypothetical protein [Reyranella sp.]
MQQEPTGILNKFHLGVSADGRSCVMVFVDEQQHTIDCVADFAEFHAFISSLNRAANEMARRRSAQGDEEDGGPRFATMNVASAAFQMNNDAGYIEGALVGDGGEIVGIRMHPEIAAQVTKAVLLTSPPASSDC